MLGAKVVYLSDWFVFVTDIRAYTTIVMRHFMQYAELSHFMRFMFISFLPLVCTTIIILVSYFIM